MSVRRTIFNQPIRCRFIFAEKRVDLEISHFTNYNSKRLFSKTNKHEMNVLLLRSIAYAGGR